MIFSALEHVVRVMNEITMIPCAQVSWGNKALVVQYGVRRVKSKGGREERIER